MSDRRTVTVCSSPEEVVTRLCHLVATLATESIQHNGNFKVGLSGGSLVKFLAGGLVDVKTDWDKWLFFLCDERVVPSDSEDSNFGAYKKHLIGKIPVKEEQFVIIDDTLSGEDAAVDYSEKLERHFGSGGLPKFDLLLLGMGEDGHTCSLFPGHRLLDESTLWVAHISDSPKPPPTRITLTLPVINNAANCVFALTGAGKADVVKRILTDDEPLPANLVRPVQGRTHFILDSSAAALIKK